MKALVINTSPVKNGATAEIAKIVSGQFKDFIDRCTPWCNTHELHASLSSEKCVHIGFTGIEYKEALEAPFP